MTQRALEPLPFRRPYRQGNQTKLVLQSQEHRRRQRPLPAHDPSGNAHRISVFRPQQFVAGEHVPEFMPHQFHHVAIGAETHHGVFVQHPIGAVACRQCPGCIRHRHGQRQLTPTHAGHVACSHLPQRGAAVAEIAEAVHGAGAGQVLQSLPGQAGPGQHVGQPGERPSLTRFQHYRPQARVNALYESQPEAQGIVALRGAEQLGPVDVGMRNPKAQSASVLLQGVQVPEPHGLLVEQGHEKLQWMVTAQPGHLVGGEGEGQGVALGEHVVWIELAENGLGGALGYPTRGCTVEEHLAIGCHQRLTVATTEGATHAVGLGGGESAHVHAQLHHLVLEHYDAL